MAEEKDLDLKEEKSEKESKKENKKFKLEEQNLDFEYDSEEFKRNLELYSRIIDKSDEIVATIYKFINKTLDPPTKAEIDLYRNQLSWLLEKVTIKNMDTYIK